MHGLRDLPPTEARQAPDRRRTRRLTIVALTATCLYAVLAGSPLLPEEARKLVAALGGPFAGAWAALFAFDAARRQPLRRARWSWLLAGLGLAASWLGGLYWVGHLVLTGQPLAVGSWADVGCLLSYPFIVAAILTRPIQRARDIHRGLLLLDAGVVLGALLAVAWHAVLAPLFQQHATDPLARAISVAYPLEDVGILFCLCILLLRETRARFSMALLVVGVGAMAVADAVNVGLTAAQARTGADSVDVIWFGGLMLIGLGGALEPPLEAMATPTRYVGRRSQFIAPAIMVLLTGALISLSSLLAGAPWPDPAIAGLAAAIVLLLTRHVVSYRDTVLAHDLLAARASEREATQAAREETARLHGVVLTAREVTHLLNNDLAVAVGMVELLGMEPGLSSEAHELLRDARIGLDRAVGHIHQLQQVSRVRTKETLVGQTLDLAGSAVPGAPAADVERARFLVLTSRTSPGEWHDRIRTASVSEPDLRCVDLPCNL